MSGVPAGRLPVNRPERLPTFIIGGARKAGTTALFRYLGLHPDIGLGAIKEPQFFSQQDGRVESGLDYGPPRSGTFDRGWGMYTEQFAGTEDCIARGEASTMYLDAPDSAELIHHHLPDVRLVFCLRHPVDRVYSHYWYERQTERLPGFSEMVGVDHPRLRWYIDQTRYAAHLERFYRYFSRDQILVVHSADLFGDSRSVVYAVCDFIGVDPGRLPEAPLAPQNRASETRSVGLQRLLTQHKSEWTRALPQALRGPARRLNSWLAHKNKRPTEYEPMDPVVRARLLNNFAEEVDRLEQLLGWSVPSWRT